MTSKPLDTQYTSPGLFRQIAALIYDLLLLLAVWMLAGLAAVALNGGQTIGPHNPLFTAYLLLVTFFFLAWFWTHGGQTLGMRSWKIKLVSQTGNTVSWRQAGLRFVGAILSWLPLGLGFGWQFISKDKLSWHDRLSSTKLILLTGQAKGK